jgi:hypothetical protein
MVGTGKTLPSSLPYCIGVCPGASELNYEKIPFVLTDVLAVIRIWVAGSTSATGAEMDMDSISNEAMTHIPVIGTSK